MGRLAFMVGLLALLGAVAGSRTSSGTAPPARAETAVVASVYDGDTLSLRDGRRVRLVQIDAPELGSGECYSRAAATALRSLVRPGTAIRLEPDASLDGTDSFGRLLRYVFRGGLNVNLDLVRQGAATPYFSRGDRGKYAGRLLAAAERAKAARKGLWKACPSTALAPDRAVDTGKSGPPAATTAKPPPTTGAGRPAGRCDPAYPTVCIPPAPPDLDCGEIPYRRFPVRPPDPHGFDGRDDDGLGCES